MPTFVLVNYAFSNLGWFITLYLIGSYIKLYGDDFKVKPWVGILLSIGIFISWFAIKTGINYGIPNRHYLLNRFLRAFNLIEMGNSVQVFCTILMFVSFSKINMKSYKWINVLASTTLAIYLLHDHGDTRHFLWLDFFKNASYSSSIYLIPYSIGVILGVFVAGLAVGLIYRYTFGLGFNKLLDLLERKLLYKIDNIVNNQPTENNVQN